MCKETYICKNICKNQTYIYIYIHIHTYNIHIHIPIQSMYIYINTYFYIYINYGTYIKECVQYTCVCMHLYLRAFSSITCTRKFESCMDGAYTSGYRGCRTQSISREFNLRSQHHLGELCAVDHGTSRTASSFRMCLKENKQIPKTLVDNKSSC